MGIHVNAKKDLHWNYYLTLIRELSTISDYVEFDEKNYATYSTENAKLLMTASSEVDVVLKLLCNNLNKKKKHKNIKDYEKTIKASVLGQNFMNEKVIIALHGLELHPWSNWKNAKTPDWWKSYNDVKHERDRHFSDATLKNVLNSVAALLICNAYLRTLEEIPKRNDVNEAICWGWGALSPRENFMKLNRLPYPLIPLT